MGGFLVLCLLCGGAYFWIKGKAKDDLAQADELYAAGKHDEAVAKYKRSFGFADTNKEQMIGRIVEHELRRGDAGEARKWVTKAIDQKLTVAWESDSAKGLHASITSERAAREAEAKAKKDADLAARKERDDKRKRFGDGSEAKRESQRLIRLKLFGAAEPKFYILAIRSPDYEQQPDGSWKVWGGFSTTNEIGVREKFVYTMTLLRMEDGSWQEIDRNLGIDPNP